MLLTMHNETTRFCYDFLCKASQPTPNTVTKKCGKNNAKEGEKTEREGIKN